MQEDYPPAPPSLPIEQTAHVPRWRQHARGASVWLGLGVTLLAGCRSIQPAAGTQKQGKPSPVASARKTINARVSVGPGTGNAAVGAMPGGVPAAPSIPKATREIHVGEVRVVGGGRRFVLIEVSPRPDMPLLAPGVELITRAPVSAAAGGEQTGTLRVSPERRQPFIVADVIDGEPHAEDPVYYSKENQPRLVPSILNTPIYSLPGSNGNSSNEPSEPSHP